MKQPRVGQYFPVRDHYWDEVERMRTPAGLPSWTFDLISIHPHWEGGYNYISPLCLVDEKTGARPRFEKLRFPTKDRAVKVARRLCRHYAGEGRVVFIVYCTDENELAARRRPTPAAARHCQSSPNPRAVPGQADAKGLRDSFAWRPR